MPREDVVMHYSCRQALATLHETPGLLDGSAVSKDLLAIIGWIVDQKADDVIGVTGSFLVGVAGARSDIDLVCYSRLRGSPEPLRRTVPDPPVRG